MQTSCISEDIPETMSSSIVSIENIDDPIFSMDFSNVREEIQKNLEDNIQIITAALEERGKYNRMFENNL